MEQKINSADFQVVGSKKTKTHRNPPTPYITSTLQQDAANKLDFATSYTMKVWGDLCIQFSFLLTLLE
jgi:DNA topoisomerase IA